MTTNSSSGLPNRPQTFVRERRETPRYSFMAVAELTDPDEGKLVSGKVTQISRNGCYVETPKTFSVGTPLKVIIFRDQRTFVAKANIMHVEEQMGMGIAFLDPSEDQVKVIDSWLADLAPASMLGGGPHTSR